MDGSIIVAVKVFPFVQKNGVKVICFTCEVPDLYTFLFVLHKNA